MTRLLSSLAARACRASATSHYGRGYIFLVVVLTVFLVGLVFCRLPVTGYTARVAMVVGGTPSGKETSHATGKRASESKLRDEILAPQAWRSVASKLAMTLDESDVAALQERTNVHFSAKPSGEVHIALWHAAPSAAGAIALAQGLADRFAAEHSQQVLSRRRCEQCDAAQANVTEAAAAMKLAQEAVESFRRQHAAELTPQPALAEVKTPAAPAKESPNPLWHEIAQRLETLRLEHAQLLQQRTAEHPAVVDLAQQIEQANAQLQATPKTITPVASATEPAEKTPATTAAKTNSKAALERADQMRRLATVADAAQRRHEAALEAERVAWQERWSQPAEQAVIVEPAQIVQRHGGGLSKARVLLVLLVAFVAGGLAAWRSQVVARPAALVSAAQVEKLGVPVVGVLSTCDGPAIPRAQPSNPMWVRYLTGGCELALAAIVALLAVIAVADGQVAAQALWDPLGAFSHALGRLAS